MVNITVSPVVMDVVDFSKGVFEGKILVIYSNQTVFYNTELIHRNLEYICKEGGHCIVDVSRRNQCQACRFSKCLKANMRREGKREQKILILFKHFNQHQHQISSLLLELSVCSSMCTLRMFF